MFLVLYDSLLPIYSAFLIPDWVGNARIIHGCYCCWSLGALGCGISHNDTVHSCGLIVPSNFTSIVSGMSTWNQVLI